VLIFNEPVPRAVQGIQLQIVGQVAADVPGALSAVAHQLQASTLGGSSVDLIAGVLWATVSIAVIAFYLLSAWRLSRRTRRWEVSIIGPRAVLVAPDLGPAVFGWWRPRVIFPRWLLSAPDEVRQLALAHENQHLAARESAVARGCHTAERAVSLECGADVDAVASALHHGDRLRRARAARRHRC
jgi:beta-lactamase regulating signal transducer with metallopeptidase domain